jgi:hypothetical protein
MAVVTGIPFHTATSSGAGLNRCTTKPDGARPPSGTVTSAGASAGAHDAPSTSAAEYPTSTPRLPTYTAAARDRSNRFDSAAAGA